MANYQSQIPLPDEHMRLLGILQIILNYVDACRKEQPRRYFDDFWLRTIGPFVDWNAVMKSDRGR
jgi:hypothetical protein